MPSELYELKVIIEADGWHDVAVLMDTVDRALDPHRAAQDGSRRWSVLANRLPDGAGRELLTVVEGRDDPPAGQAPERLTA